MTERLVEAMSLTIEKEALKTVLYSTLSCRCPITEETESRLFQAFQELDDRPVVDLALFMAIADQDPVPTPLHIFKEFCSYSKEDPNDFAITHDDAIRYFSSKFHFDRVVQGLDPLIVNDTAGFLVGHMLTPVRYGNVEETGRAVFSMGECIVTFSNLFVPPAWDGTSEDWVGVHLGAIVTGLSEDQAQMALRHLAVNQAFPKLLHGLTEVDYHDFQEYGDYRSIVENRFKRYY